MSRAAPSRTSPAQRRGSRAAKPDADARVRRDKLSISLDPADVSWVTRRARTLGTSVSAVLAEAIAAERRAEATTRLLSLVGGTEDLGPELLERARAEMRDP